MTKDESQSPPQNSSCSKDGVKGNIISCFALKYTPCIILTYCNHLGNISKAPFIDLTAGKILLPQILNLYTFDCAELVHLMYECAGLVPASNKP